jgi:hypothetical protein
MQIPERHVSYLLIKFCIRMSQLEIVIDMSFIIMLFL